MAPKASNNFESSLRATTYRMKSWINLWQLKEPLCLAVLPSDTLILNSPNVPSLLIAAHLGSRLSATCK